MGIYHNNPKEIIRRALVSAIAHEESWIDAVTPEYDFQKMDNDTKKLVEETEILIKDFKRMLKRRNNY